MTEKEFTNQYWKQYLMIEKEFKATVKYVAVDEINFSTFSDAYLKIILQIGSEVDVVAKELCRTINATSTAHKIDQYEIEIKTRFSEFQDVNVSCGELDFHPWDGWNESSPEWWKIYNGVKHSRNAVEEHYSITQENYKFANQKTVLNALAGLYQLEQYLYSVIPHESHTETPIPGSRLFQLTNQGWENTSFGKDDLFYIQDGHLIWSRAEISYADI